MSLPARILLVFLDGVGVGPSDTAVNPFLSGAARLPTLMKLMGGEALTFEHSRRSSPGGHSFSLAATLDVEGTPQSGTGQVALLTGANAAEIFGRHFGPWTPTRLRPLLESRNVLSRAKKAGRSVAFANAYPDGWRELRSRRRPAGPPLAALGAGVLDRHLEALRRGDAVASEFVNDGWRSHFDGSLPDVTAAEAGANLARISRKAHLTLFAHYATDAAGHAMDMGAAIAALSQVDEFLNGVLEELEPDTLMLVVSDHGNIEDVRHGHTRNPALGIATGPGSDAAAHLSDLREVAAFVLGQLGVVG